MRFTRSTAISCALLVTTLTFTSSLHAEADYHDDPAFKKKWEDAKHTHQVDDKAAAYRKANDASGNRCEECLLEAVRLSSKSGDTKQVVKTVDLLLKMPTATPRGKAKAENYAGLAFGHNVGEAKKDDLEKAHAYYTKAIADDATFDPPYFNDATVLVALEKKDDAVKLFQALQKQTSVPAEIRQRAARYEKEPDLVLVRHTPTISFEALDGRTIALKNLGNGKVTLLIFCQTTRDAGSQSHYEKMLPHLQQIAKQYQDAPFQMASVYVGQNKADATRFLEKHQLGWPQYIDDSKVSSAFHISRTPHITIVGGDGTILFDEHMSNSQIDSELAQAIADAKKPSNGE